MDLKKIRNLRHIRRFNFHHCNKYETVAEHLCFATIIALDVALHLNMSQKDMNCLLQIVLLHDITEAVIGDIGYLVRNRIPDAIKTLEAGAGAEIDIDILHCGRFDMLAEFIDTLELKMYLEEERKSGNSILWDIECETYHRILTLQKAIDENLNKYIEMLDVVPEKVSPKEMSH